MNQPSLFAAVPTAADAPDDAAWLAQVRADAGRWWSSTDRDRSINDCPLYTILLLPATVPHDIVTATHPWQVRHRMSDTPVGGNWRLRHDARLWLWLALGLCSWHLVPDVATARATWGDALDAAEARLRRALGGAG